MNAKIINLKTMEKSGYYWVKKEHAHKWEIAFWDQQTKLWDGQYTTEVFLLVDNNIPDPDEYCIIEDQMNEYATRFFKKYGYRHGKNDSVNSFYAIVDQGLNEEFPGVIWKWLKDEFGYNSIVKVIFIDRTSIEDNTVGN